MTNHEIINHDPFIQFEEQEILLERRIREMDLSCSGLKDGEEILKLISLKLEMATHLIRKAHKNREDDFKKARKRGLEALSLLESLHKENVSLDQSGWLKDLPGYEPVKAKLQELLLAGGINLFDSEIDFNRIGHKVARVVTDALLKYSVRDDLYEQTFKTEKLPSFFRRLVNKYLPVFKKEYQKPPPYGIEEGEEVVYKADKIKMPLSQAIGYLEEEVLPLLTDALANDPGNEEVQEKIIFVSEKIEEYKNISLIPRARPFVPEKGYDTNSFSSLTDKGEPLISMPLEVTFPSYTNTERLMNLVRLEVVKNLAGQGVFPSLDKEYKYLKSLDSGLKGSSRLPGNMLNYPFWFNKLKREVPFLRRIEEPEKFKQLMEYTTKVTKQEAAAYICNEIKKEKSIFALIE